MFQDRHGTEAFHNDLAKFRHFYVEFGFTEKVQGTEILNLSVIRHRSRIRKDVVLLDIHLPDNKVLRFSENMLPETNS